MTSSTSRLAIAVLFAAAAAVGQPRPGVGGGGRGNTFRPPARTPGRVFIPPPASHPFHSPTVIVPYPVFYGVYNYAGYPSFFDPLNPPQQQDPNQAANQSSVDPNYQAYYGDSNAAPSQSPVVIINQSFRPDTVNPSVRDYSDVPLPPGPNTGAGAPPNAPSGTPADDQPTIYLIALKDHTIFPAVAYWVEGDTLNYITTEGNQNRASMALVDREFSKKLNDDRHVEFRLPAIP